MQYHSFDLGEDLPREYVRLTDSHVHPDGTVTAQVDVAVERDGQDHVISRGAWSVSYSPAGELSLHSFPRLRGGQRWEHWQPIVLARFIACCDAPISLAFAGDRAVLTGPRQHERTDVTTCLRLTGPGAWRITHLPSDSLRPDPRTPQTDYQGPLASMMTWAGWADRFERMILWFTGRVPPVLPDGWACLTEWSPSAAVEGSVRLSEPVAQLLLPLLERRVMAPVVRHDGQHGVIVWPERLTMYSGPVSSVEALARQHGLRMRRA